MAVTPSTMLPLGTPAPDFALEDLSGASVARDDFAGDAALLVMFICNHCPFVQHVAKGLTALANDYAGRGVAIVAINANDTHAYQDDSPANMRLTAEEHGWSFPYLLDETQEVAKAYRAACTPDLFLFDGERRLVYRGQLDGARPGNDIPVTGEDLRTAIDAVLEGRPVPTEQRASIGCSIKWREGDEPDYFG
jgi:peroxiredoxin